ncbi:MAG: YheU family protein [Pseudomonadales bacterium]|jgi:uncharacterized protein YheU (UPF0270 family)
MIIPWQSLSESALVSLIQEFVSREGTEYGSDEVSLQDKVTEVLDQLERGVASIAFDTETQTTTIIESSADKG